MEQSLDFDLSAHRIDADDLHDVYYVPDFVTEEEESYLIRQVHRTDLHILISLLNTFLIYCN